MKSPTPEIFFTGFRRLPFAGLLFLLVFFAFPSSEAQAATKVWLPTTGGAWTTGTNWSPIGVPVAGDDVIIATDQAGNITAVPTISLLSLTVNGSVILAGTSGNTVTITGTLSVAAGETLTMGAGGARINLTLAASGSGTIAGTVTIASFMGTPRLFLVDGALTIPAGGLVNDTGGANISNFTLSAAGTLRIGSTSGISIAGPTGAIQVTGTRTYSTGAHYVYNGSANQITGLGLTQNTPADVTISSGFIVDLSAATTISGELSITSGTLDLNGFSANVGSVSGSGMTTSGVAGAVTLTTGSDGTSTTYTGVIQNGTGTVSLTKTGAGTLTLGGGGASTYTGNTNINGGTLRLNSTTALGNAGGAGTIVASGATLDLNGQNYAATEALSLNGNGVSGNGALINSSAVAATYGGLITLAGPSSIVGGTGAINLSNVGNITGATNGLRLGGAAGGSLTSGISTTTGTLTKADAGTWTLSGTGSFTGGTTINDGTLRLSNTAALGIAGSDVTLTGGILDLATDLTVNAYDVIIGGTSTILSNQAPPASAGIIHVLGTLNIGAFTLTVSPGGNVSGGTPGVQFGNVTMAGPSILNIDPGVTVNASGSIGGSGKLTKSGTGTLQKITADWTLPGDFEITAGTYNANGRQTTVTGIATVSGGTYTGNTATQTFNGGLTISGGTFTGSTGGVTTTNVTLSSGTLTAPSGTFNVSGNWNKTGGTFTPGANTVTFNGGGLQILNSGGSAFNHITHNAAGTIQLSVNPLTTGGNFLQSLGVFDANDLAHTVTGPTSLSGGNYLAKTGTQSLNGGLLVGGGIFTGSTGSVSTSSVLLSSGTLTAPTSFNVSGNWTYSGGTFNNSSGTVTFNGAAQNIIGPVSTPFFNVSTSGASNTSINIATTIANNLSIRNATTINVTTFPFAVNGATTVGGGASGNLTFSTATGPNTFGGLVTVASGATWDNTINAPMFFRGGITNNGTFTAGTTALHTFDTNPQSLTGTLNIPNVTVTGVTLINNNSLTVGTALEGSGILFQAATGILNVGGTSGIALISAANSGNLVNFNGSAQTINPTTYHHLTVNQSAGVAILSGPTSANGTLTLTAGGINLGGNTLTMGPASTVAGAPTSTNMIIASGGGELRKQYSGTGSFLFPIGDNTGGADYSPITVNVTAGSFSSAYVGVSAVDAKHPSDASTVDYLDRYWNVTPSGITGGVATITATYPGGDLQGTPANVAPAKLTGTFNPITNPWIKDAGSIASPFTIVGASIPSGQASAFTGVTRGNPVAAAGTDKTICNLANVTLGGAPTGTGGVGTLSYSWSPSAGLSATNVANPIFTASSTGTTTYTVTVTDANGSIGTDQVDVIVNVVPAAPSIAPAVPPVQCQGAGNIILTSTTPVGTDTYQWYKNGILLVGETAISHTVIDAAANSGNYTVTAIGVAPTLCASTQSAAVSVIINPLPSVTPPVGPATTTICSGATVTVTVTGSEAGINYEVFDGVTSVSGVTAGTGGNINIVTSALTASATLTVRATNPTTTCTTLLTGTVGVTVNPIPAQPVPTTPGPFVQCVGTGNILLTSNTPAGTVSWQWYKDGVLIGGATSISYTVVDLVANSGNYTVTAIGAAPTLCTSIQSAPVSVTINPLPIVTPPVGPATTTICSGATVTVTVTGSEAGINYEVFDGVTSVSGVTAGTGGNINIVTSALTASSTLTVRATNPTTTCTTLLTGTVGVTVNPIPAQPVPTTPGPFVQCLGTGNIILTSNTPAGTVSWQWYKDGVLIGGATSISYTVVDLVANSGNYTVTAIGAAPTLCTSIQSAPVSVTINPLPSVTPPVGPATTTICSGATVSVTVTTSEAGINYQVFDGVTPVSGVVAGTGGNINIVTSALTASSTLTVRATNPTTTCTTLLTGTVGVTVNPIPAQPVPTTPGPFVQCLGTGNIILTSNTPAGTVSWQWYKDGALIGGATAINYTVVDLVANSGSYTVTAIGTAPTLCTSIQSAPISVTINPLPIVTPPVGPATTTICSGATVTVTVTGSEAGINYEVFDGVTSVSGVTAGTGGNINIVTSALTASATLTVRATNPATSCTTLLTGTVGVTVNPIPAQPVPTTPGPFVQCLGTGNIILTSNTPAGTVSWQWYKDGALIGGATSISYTVVDLVANSGNYTVTAIGAAPTLCTSIQSAPVSVTINPLPIVTPPVGPATTTICSGATVSVTVTTSEAGINYQVFDGVTPVSGVVAGTGGNINIVTSALTASATLTVRATNPTTTCTTLLTGTVGVTVNPIPAQPVPTTPGPFVQCVGTGNILLTSNTPAGTVSWQWYKDGVLIGGATSINYTVVDLVANSGNYTVTAIGAVPTLCTSIQSAPVSVTINPLPIVTPPVGPATTTICSGATVTVTVTGSEAGINYEVFDGVTSVSGVTAGTGGNINIVTSALTASATLTVRATNPTTTCTTLLTGTVGVTVNPIPAQPVPTTPGPFVQCVGTGNILLTSNTPAGTVSWQWYKDGALIGGATAINYTVVDLVANSGSYTVTAIGTAPTLCTSIQSAPISVTINPLPIVTPPVGPATTTICSGATVTVTVTGSEAGINYEVFDGVTSVSGVTAGTGGNINIVTSALTASATLTVRATNPTTTCTTLLTGTVGVTVNPIPAQPVPTTPGPFVQCVGTGNILLTSNTPAGTVSWQWYKDGALIGGATAINYTVVDLVANSGSYTVTAIGTAPTLCTSIQSAPISVTINPLPIVTPPVGPATTTICSGATVTVTVTGSEAGINYEVFDGVTSVSGVTAGTGGNINIVTSALTASATLTVRATNPTTTCTTLLTGTVGVTVNPIPPTPTVGPAGPVVVCQGTGAVTLTSSAGSGNQWYKNGGILAGETGVTLNISDVPASSGNYTVVVTLLGCNSLASVPVSVTINPLVTANAGATPVTVCEGTAVLLGGSPTGGGGNGSYTFSWTSVPPGFTSASSNPPVTPAVGTTTYSVLVTDGNGCTATANKVVNVNPVPVVAAVPDQAGCPAAAQPQINFTSTTDPGTSYNWSVSNFAALGMAAGSGSTDNIPSFTYAANATAVDITGLATVTANEAGCFSAPVSFTITLHPKPILAPVSDVTVCPGSPVNVNFGVDVAGALISWNNSDPTIGLAASGTGDISFTALSAQPTDVVADIDVTASKDGCTSNVLLFQITVKPFPTLTITNAVPAFCTGGTTDITLDSPTTGAVITLNSVFYNGATGGTFIGGETFVDDDQILETLSNATTAPVTVVYQFTIAAGICIDPTIQSVSVTVDPNPVLSSTLTPASICDDATFNYTATSATVGATFAWSRALVAGITPGTNSGVTGVISEALSNANTTPTVVTYQFTTSRLGCSTIENVLLTVNPTPLLTSTVTPAAICSGTVFNYTATSSTPGATFGWSRAAVVGISEVASAGAANVSETLTNTTAAAINVTYVYVVSANGCTNPSSYNVVVSVSPSPVLTSTLTPADICSGATFNYTATTGTGSPSFAWTRALVGGISEGASGGATAVIAETLTNTTTAPVNVTYVFVVTAAGCPGPAQNVVVTVNPNPVLSSTLTPASICDDATFNYTATSATVGATFAWSRALVAGITPGTNSGVTGVISEALSNANTTPTVVTYQFTTSRLGCSTIENVLLTVNPTPLLTSTVTPAAICSGTVFNYTATSSTPGATFGWSRAAVVGISEVASAGAANVSETLTNTTAAAINVTYVYVVSANGCTNPSSYNVVVSVSPSPVLTSTLTPADICSGATFNYTATTGTGSPSFAWTRALVGGISEGASGGATAVIAETLTNTTTAPVNVTYVFVVTAAGCPGPAQNVVVTVNPNPVLSSTLTPASICDDATFNYTATSATVGATFAWSRALVAGITPATSSGVTGVISEALSNANTTPTVVTYQFTTSRLGCSTIENVLLTVNPTPLLTSTVTPAAICSGTVFNYTATSSTPGATFGWSRAAVVGISEVASAGAANVSETLTNTTAAAINVTYVYVVSANGCTNPSSYNVVVSVSPSPVLTSTLTPADICSGATFNYTATTGTGSPSFAWTRALVGGISEGASGGATAVIAETLTNTTTAPVNVTYVFVVTAAGCPGPAQNVVVTVNPNPVLSSTLTPASICDDATFNYTATSATVGATFAWSRALVAGITPATSSGVTGVISEALSNANTTPTVVTYQFTTSRLGCSTIENVLLTVNPTPLLTSTVTPAAICSGTVFNYTATSSTPGATFGWSRAAVVGISEVASAGAANVSETLTNTTAAAINVTYVYVVSANGCTNPSSYNVVVSVSPSPVLTSTLTPADICSGATFNYTATTGTGSPSFAWTRALVGGISEGASSGATAVIAETLTNTTTAPVNVTYVFVVTAAGCPGPAQNVVVTVNPNPVLSSTLTPASICDDATFNYTATSATVGATFAWSRALVAGITPGTNSGVTGVISEALSNANTTPTVVTYQFTTSRLGCSTIENVLLTVNPTPLLTSTVTPAAICSGTVFTYTATSSTPGATFGWSRAAVVGISEVASAGAANVSETLTNTTAAAINVTYVYVVSANGCTNPSSYNVVVSVSPSPVLTSTLTPADICSGATFNYTATTGTGSPSFAWTRALVGGISEGASGGATAVIAETLTNTTTAPVNVTYVFVVTAAGCPGPAQNVVVTVNPNPVLSSTLTPASICDDATFNYTATSATVGATFAWSRALVAGITPATSSGVTGVISEALSNANTTPTVVTYQFTTSRLGCSTIENVLLTVNPTPLLTSTVTPAAICSGTVFTYTATSSTPGATFGWSRAAVVGISEVASAGAANVSETLTNTTAAAINVTYVYVVSANGCTNPSSYNVVVAVNPPAVFAAANVLPALCEGVATSINLTSSTTGQRVTLVSVVAPGSVGGYTAAGTQYNAFPASIADMLTNSSTSPQTVTYTFEGSLGGTCINPAQQVVVVTVNPAPPDLSVVNALLTLCKGTPNDITLNSATANAIITLTNVQYNGATGTLVNGTTFTPGSKITETLGNSTNAPITVDYTFQVSANGCTNPATTTSSVSVKPEPVFSITNTTPLICEAVPVDITLNSPTVNAIMTLTSVNYGTVIGTLSAGATYTDGQKITEVLNNPTNVAVNVTYTFDVRTNAPAPTCQNPVTQQTVVIVKPKPSANGTDITICSGQNAVIPINPSPENVAGTTYDWTFNASANVVGATNDNGSLINQPITLTNFSVGTIQYHVTPTANGCVGPVKDLNVTVNPIATVNAGADYQVCEPATIPLSGIIGGAATSGTWTIITGSGSISASSTAGTTVTATYTVNPLDISTTLVFRLQTNDPDTGGPCSAVSDQLNVQVNRMAFVSVPADYVVCEPVSYIVFPIQLTGTIGASATTGLWSVITGNGGLSATSISGATVNAEYVIDPSDVGTVVTFRLTTNDPDGTGPCVAVFDDINITINLRATVDAGPDLELCSSVPSIGLLGSYGGSASAVLWSGGAGVFSTPSSATSNYFWANPPELNTNITLTLTALDPDAGGPCTSVADQMVLTINPLPVVFFSGLPPGSPPNVAENTPPITLVGNQQGGLFTIAPATSNIGSTVQAPGDQAVFDPSAVTLGVNTITYTYTDLNGCTNLQNQPVIVNPVTSATFAIQNGAFNSLTLSHEVCAEQGDLLLTGSPDFNTFGPNQFIASPGLTINQSGSPGSFVHTISTNGLAAGTYTIDYVYTNAFGATSHNTFAVKVFAAPIPVIQVNNSCIVAAIEFRDFSYLPATNPYPTTITGWLWDFDDNQFSTLQNPDHVYAVASLYDVNLKVTTQQGCTQNVTQQIRVGDVPIVDFDWSAICNNDQTKFQDQTNPGTVSVITNYTWDFGDGNIISGPPGGAVASGGSTGIYEQPDHNYALFGSYNAKLTVDTNDGCSNSLTKNVFILPYTTVVPASTSAYSETFEANNGGWVAEAFFAKNSTPINIIPSDTSWVYGTPGFNKFTPNPTGPKAWWTGKDNVNMTYYPYENSAVNGPCFNLDQLQRPMISLDYWSDTQRGIDGVTLQYSVDAGLTWRIIGPAEGLIDRDQGINWFNGTGISANPGNQFIGQYGWTDRSEGWKNARFNLDMIDPTMRSQVRIRFALGSNDSNPANENYDGFAFDNIYVGEKQRNVLVEHFTNSSLQASVDGDTYINNLYQAQITFRGASDFYDIQYHINTPGTDQLNVDNVADPGARSTYMGVSEPPKTIMDGILNTKFTGKYTDLNQIELDRRALADPLFDLLLDTIPTNDKNTISVRLTITAKKAVNTPLIAQVVILENQTGTFQNVLRKHLFGADGETITVAFTPGLALMRQRDNVIIDVPLTNPAQLTLVAYVQDKNTKEIYQSIIKAAPYKRGTVIVGLEETPAPTTLNGISIYPNPANGHFYFGLPDSRTTAGFEWKLIDQRGVTVKSGDFEGSIDNTKIVHTDDLANGVYIIMLSGPGRSVVHRKIIIMNRN